MKLKGIMAISGYPGLFKMVSQAKNSIIVESLLDGKRMPAFNSYKISSLEDIAMFTTDKEVPLTEVFIKLKEKYNGQKALDLKAANNELVKAFSEILPDYDRDRVYVSDIKKVFSWYNLLVDKDMLKDEPAEEAEVSENATGVKEEVQTDKVKKPKSGVAKEKVTAKPRVVKSTPKSPVVRKAGGQRKQGGE
jgi:hypothetical protein